MGRVHVLPDQVANKIAAGEVVERPASVVKELLENSLDAGAGELRIDIESGGRRLIRVADDGCGMLRDDALLAFERHATSKLTDVKDLVKIATLGFRGEALPSIASVSRLVLETRSDDEPTGARVEIAGGRLNNCSEAALPRGTTITVRDLFYNVPARRNFLKTNTVEFRHILDEFERVVLANPDIFFSLHHNGSEVFHLPPGNLRQRILGVFGVVLVVGGIAWYQLSGQKRRKAVHPQRKKHKQDESQKGETTYCPQCGKRATGQDRFCRACGGKLRREE